MCHFWENLLPAAVSAPAVAICLNSLVKTIMDTAGWANAVTFSKFYDKPIRASVSDNFGVDLLKTQC